MQQFIQRDTDGAASPLAKTLAADMASEVFEGPEKKLEVFFHPPTEPDGFRHYQAAAWSDVLADASCSILHVESNAQFDAYLLSESSLFVYPHKLVLKTCGTTTLLLVLPKVLALADDLGAGLSHVHYSRLRYKFPHMQLYPHSSFDEERVYLAHLLEGRGQRVVSRVLGPEDARDGAMCWYALGSEAAQPAAAPAAAARSDKTVVEVAMEGLPPAVCDIFFGTDAMHGGLRERALAQSMSALSGIASLVPGATIDDWAFEPCGYSMNALKGEHYYTVHITPEADFSYASFETTDPAFASSAKLTAILQVFRPSTFTLTLTNRGDGAQAVLPADALQASADGFVLGALDQPLRSYACASNERAQLTPSVAITCAAFALHEAHAAERAAAPKAAAAAVDLCGAAAVRLVGSKHAAGLSSTDSNASDSEAAESESTAPLDDVSSLGAPEKEWIDKDGCSEGGGKDSDGKDSDDACSVAERAVKKHRPRLEDSGDSSGTLVLLG